MVDLQAPALKDDYDRMMTLAENFYVASSYIMKNFFGENDSVKLHAEQIEQMPKLVVPNKLKKKLAATKISGLVKLSADNSDPLASVFSHFVGHDYAVVEYKTHMIRDTDLKARTLQDEKTTASANRILMNFTSHQGSEQNPKSFAHQRLEKIHVLDEMRKMVRGEKNEIIITKTLNQYEDLVTEMTGACEKFSSDVLAQRPVAA